MVFANTEIKNNWNASGFLEPDISLWSPLLSSIAKRARVGRETQAGVSETLPRASSEAGAAFDLGPRPGSEVKTRLKFILRLGTFLRRDGPVMAKCREGSAPTPCRMGNRRSAVCC